MIFFQIFQIFSAQKRLNFYDINDDLSDLCKKGKTGLELKINFKKFCKSRFPIKLFFRKQDVNVKNAFFPEIFKFFFSLVFISGTFVKKIAGNGSESCSLTF